MPAPSRRSVLLSCATAAAGLAGCAIPGSLESTQSSDELSIPAETPLVVTNVNGTVHVEDGGGDTATLEVRKTTRYGADLFEKVHVETGTSGDAFRIETVDDTPPGKSVSVDLTLYLPENVPVERAKTSNGDVTVQEVGGDATLQTTNGDVRADGVDGYVTLRSGNGDVTARGVTGLDGARTSNGSVDVEVSAMRGDVRAETTNGNVRVAVPEDLNAVVNLQTKNGDVGYSGLDLDVSVKRSTHIKGTLGTGGDELRAETTNGDVRLRPL
ncbi:MAG: DUF4097 domain-containing protein [Halapricum sp.]